MFGLCDILDESRIIDGMQRNNPYRLLTHYFTNFLSFSPTIFSWRLYCILTWRSLFTWWWTLGKNNWWFTWNKTLGFPAERQRKLCEWRAWRKRLYKRCVGGIETRTHLHVQRIRRMLEERWRWEFAWSSGDFDSTRRTKRKAVHWRFVPRPLYMSPLNPSSVQLEEIKGKDKKQKIDLCLKENNHIK